MTVPRGVVFSGPPGAGKTYAARHLVELLRSLEVPASLYAFCADEFESASQVRWLVEHLSGTTEHVLLVIDEVDLIARHRGSGRSGREERRMLSALLSSLDGMTPASRLTVVGLTSEGARSLDPAVRRPGRMNLTIVFELPDEAERDALWRLYLADTTTEGDIDLDALVGASHGASPAAITEWIVSAVGIAYADGGRTAVTQADLDAAIGRHGEVRVERPIEFGTWRVRVHEAGHVAVAVALCGAAFVSSVRTGRGYHATNLANGSGDGAQGDATLLDQICVCFGGTEAEALLIGERSTGSTDDIARATDLALDRVQAALPADVPPVSHPWAEKVIDETWKRAISEHLDRTLTSARERAAAIVRMQRDAITRFADALGTTPDLEGDELVDVIRIAGFRGPDDLVRPDPSARDGVLTPA